MKRLISVLACVLAVLIWTSTPALAVFVGTLRSDMAVTVEVSASANSLPTAVAVILVDSRGRQHVDFLASVQGGTAGVTEVNPKGIRRIIVVDPPLGGTAFVRVTQGTFRTEYQVDQDVRLVYDVAP